MTPIFSKVCLTAAAMLSLCGLARLDILPTLNDEQEEQGPAQDPGYFKQWFERHKDDQGKIPSGLHASWYRHDRMLANAKGKANVSSPIDSVICLGPFNSGGRTRGMIVSNNNNNLLFAGGISGGMWKSSNAGASWTQINDAAVNLMVSCITQSPFNANIIYYGTGESRANSAGTPGDGIFKSTDGGNTFTQLAASASISALDNVWAIEHSKTDSLTVYAGTNSSGLYRSTNGGGAWSQVTGTAGSITDLITFANGSVLIARNGTGLYLSPSGAPSTFTQITSAAFPASFQRIEIANCKNFPNVIYAAFERTSSYSNSGLAAFCKSSDGGLTWTALTSPTGIGFTYDRYCLLLGVSPTDSNKVVCGGSGLQYSSNGASSWLSCPYGHADHHVVGNATNGFFYMGSDGGVHRKHWDSLGTTARNMNSGYVTFQFYAGNYASTARTCAGGTQDNGTWRFLNATEKSILGGDGGYTHVNLQNNNTAYAATQNGALYRTANFLASSPSFSSIAPSTTEGKDFINAYQINYAEGTQLYYRTAAGLWRTTDSGATWTKLNTTNISGIQAIGCTNVSNPAVYIAGSSIFYRFDNAKTFVPGSPVNLSSTKPNTDPVGTISVNPLNANTLYIGLTNYVNRPRAYKVVDASTATPTWINISGDLPSSLPVNQIQADPSDTNVLFAATDFGLYFSLNGGTNWYKESRIPNVAIFEMKMRTADRRLFLFTHGRGVWYLSLKLPVAIALPLNQTNGQSTGIKDQSRLAFQVYPNPVQHEVNVRFERAPSGLLDLELYNLDGKLLRRETYINTGEEEMSFPVADLPPGIYLLRLNNGEHSGVQRLVKAQ